jgi:hypothetical protein
MIFLNLIFREIDNTITLARYVRKYEPVYAGDSSHVVVDGQNRSISSSAVHLPNSLAEWIENAKRSTKDFITNGSSTPFTWVTNIPFACIFLAPLSNCHFLGPGVGGKEGRYTF